MSPSRDKSSIQLLNVFEQPDANTSLSINFSWVKIQALSLHCVGLNENAFSAFFAKIWDKR